VEKLGYFGFVGSLACLSLFCNLPKTSSNAFCNFGRLEKVLLAFVSFAGSAADVSLDSAISARTIKAILLGGILLILALICVVRNIPFDFRLKKYSTLKLACFYFSNHIINCFIIVYGGMDKGCGIRNANHLDEPLQDLQSFVCDYDVCLAVASARRKASLAYVFVCFTVFNTDLCQRILAKRFTDRLSLQRVDL
jgi:hypothetical protein